MHVTERTSALLAFGFGGRTLLMSPRHKPGNNANPCKAAPNFHHWETNLWAKNPKITSAPQIRVEENRRAPQHSYPFQIPVQHVSVLLPTGPTETVCRAEASAYR